MKVTLADVANCAGVSTATVSHVINHTRYVTPQLREKVIEAIHTCGYKLKDPAPSNQLDGKNSELACIVPQSNGTFFSNLINNLIQVAYAHGYVISIYLSFNDSHIERQLIQTVTRSKRFGGLFIVPCNQKNNNMKLLRQLDIPLVCIQHYAEPLDLPCVNADIQSIIYKCTQTLIHSGHTKIGVLLSNSDSYNASLFVDGYAQAMYDNNITYAKEAILSLDSQNPGDCEHEIIRNYESYAPTAYIACSSKLTVALLSIIKKLDISVPSQLSIIGHGEEPWHYFLDPTLSTFSFDSQKIAESSMEMMMHHIQNKPYQQQIMIPSILRIRQSIKLIEKGPYGEHCTDPSALDLTTGEIQELQSKKYSVGVSFHYGNTLWATMHEKGLRYILSRYGISIVAVTNANFDPALQAVQLDSLVMQKVDAIVAIPVDDLATSQKFKEISNLVKLVFISNIPESISKCDYYSLVSANELENGRNGAIILGEYFKGQSHVPIGLITHGSKFWGTHLRDMSAEQTIRDEYPNLSIVQSDSFYNMDNAGAIAQKMLEAHPEIKALYVSWEGPALEVIDTLRNLGRMDIKIVTFDLDYKIANALAKDEFVIGLSAQRAYEQGIAAGQAVAKALLNQRGYEFIGISPAPVNRYNLLSSWRDIIGEQAPEAIVKALKDKTGLSN